MARESVRGRPRLPGDWYAARGCASVQGGAVGHSSSDDPTKYRDDAEVKEWEQKDPIDRFRRHLTLRGRWDDAKEAALKERLAAVVNDAIAAAEGVGPPADATLITVVFAERPRSCRSSWRRCWRSASVARTRARSRRSGDVAQ